MGRDRIRHLVTRTSRRDGVRYFWQPSKTLLELGLVPEALGADRMAAENRARSLNQHADEIRIGTKTNVDLPKAGTLSLLFAAYLASDEFKDLKPRSRRDHTYYLRKIELEFGDRPVSTFTPAVIKAYYKRIVKDVSVTWGYHIVGTWRAVLSWGVSEDWLEANPALDVRIKSPAKRRIIWTAEESKIYLAQAAKDGWPSIVAMVHVFDSIGQSPVDVRTLSRKAYDGRCIDVTRAKTGMEGAPIPLFPDAVRALDAYLASQPAKLPDAPLFTDDKLGSMWTESRLQKTHARIRKAAGLRFELQLQDFRTTAQTEGGASGGTVDELRGLARHATRSAGEHYVMPDARYVESIQAKRLAKRSTET